jgi:Zn-dependent membrane protease YugP
MSWIILVSATMILGGIGQLAVSSAYKKWGNVVSSIDLTGADMAIRMLGAYG